MFKHIRKHKYKKGFTFIELIVVIAIIALLVLLAAPKFIGKTNEAKLTQIQNDIRVAEGKLAELLVKKPESYEEWTTIEEEVLQDFIESEHLFGRGGPVFELETGPYKEVSENFIDDINTQLDGDFYANEKGTIYYVFDKQPNTGLNLYANKKDKLIGSQVKEYDKENDEIVFYGPENLFDGDINSFSRSNTVITWEGNLTHRELEITGRGYIGSFSYHVDLYFTDDNKNRINPIGINTSYVRFTGTQPVTKTIIVPEGATQLHIKHESSSGYQGYIYEIEAPDTLTRPSNIDITHKTYLDSIEFKWDTVKRAYIFENGNFIKEVDGTSSKHTPKVLTQEYDIDILFINEYGNGVLIRQTIDRGNVSLATDDFGSELFDNDLETFTRRSGVIQIDEHLKHRELKITGRGYIGSFSYHVDLYFTDKNGDRINPMGNNLSYVRFTGTQPVTKTMIVPEGATQLHIKHESSSGYQGYIYEIKVPDTLARPSNMKVSANTNIDSMTLKWDKFNRALVYENGQFVHEIHGQTFNHLVNTTNDSYYMDVLIMNESGNGTLITKIVPKGELGIASSDYNNEIIDNNLETYTRKQGVIYLSENMANREIEITGKAHRGSFTFSIYFYFKDKEGNNMTPVGESKSRIEFNSYSKPETKTVIVPDGAREIHIVNESSAASYRGYFYDLIIKE